MGKGESDGHGGMVLKFHHANFFFKCDDGFAAIVDTLKNCYEIEWFTTY
jgi:hypothetical protein